MALSIFMLKKCVTSFFILVQESKQNSFHNTVSVALRLRCEGSFQLSPSPGVPLQSTEGRRQPRSQEIEMSIQLPQIICMPQK